MYGGEVIGAVTAGLDLPPMPETLAGLTAGKLGNTARGTLMAVGTGLTIAQVQVMSSKPKLSAALRYISQGIAALLAGRPIPSPSIA